MTPIVDMIQCKQYKLIIYINMIKILTELEKRGHRAQLTLNGSESNSWVSLITVQDKDWSTIKMRSELSEEFSSKRLFNSMLYSLLRNGYKLINLK